MVQCVLPISARGWRGPEALTPRCPGGLHVAHPHLSGDATPAVQSLVGSAAAQSPLPGLAVVLAEGCAEMQDTCAALLLAHRLCCRGHRPAMRSVRARSEKDIRPLISPLHPPDHFGWSIRSMRRVFLGTLNWLFTSWYGCGPLTDPGLHRAFLCACDTYCHVFALRGFPWAVNSHSVAVRGSPWVSVAFRGSPWLSCGVRGFRGFRGL